MSDEEEIRAEHTFFERAAIDRSKIEKTRPSPDLSTMFGVEITEVSAVGTVKKDTFWWGTKDRRDEKLPRIKARYNNPVIKYIGLT
jgi:hypothetical protein